MTTLDQRITELQDLVRIFAEQNDEPFIKATQTAIQELIRQRNCPSNEIVHTPNRSIFTMGKTTTTSNKQSPRLTPDEFRAFHVAAVYMASSKNHANEAAKLEADAKKRVLPVLQSLVSRHAADDPDEAPRKQFLFFTLSDKRKVTYESDAARRWILKNLGEASHLVSISQTANKAIITHMQTVRDLREAYDNYTTEVRAETQTDETPSVKEFLEENLATVAPFIARLMKSLLPPSAYLEIDDAKYKAEVLKRMDEFGATFDQEHSVLMQMDDNGDMTPTMPMTAVLTDQTISYSVENGRTGLDLLAKVEIINADEQEMEVLKQDLEVPPVFVLPAKSNE